MSDAPVFASPIGARRMWSGMPNAETRGTATPRSSAHRCTCRKGDQVVRKRVPTTSFNVPIGVWSDTEAIAALYNSAHTQAHLHSATHGRSVTAVPGRTMVSASHQDVQRHCQAV